MPAPVKLAQHLTDIGLVSACTFKLLVLVLDIGAREDLSSLYGWNGFVLVKKSPEIQIVTDVRPSGYGATWETGLKCPKIHAK